MLKRVVFIILISILFCLSAVAGGKREDDSGPMSSTTAGGSENSPVEKTSYLEITDSAGKLIKLDKPISRLVSLGPVVTETVYALGRENILVGRTAWCNYPPECLSLPSVGDIQGPSTETIISLSPDFVLSSGHAPVEEMELLKNAGIPTAVFYGPGKFAGVYDVINGIAALLDASEEGEKICADMKARAETVVGKVAKMEERPRVYYVVGFGDGGDWTAGKDTFIHEMMTMAGGENIAGDIEGWSYSLETLIEKDPDIIIIVDSLKNQFCSSEFYSELTAVIKGRVYGIDENIVVRQGPRLIEGLELLYDIFSSPVEEVF